MEDRTLLATVIWTIPPAATGSTASNWVNASDSPTTVPTSSDDAEINIRDITVTHTLELAMRSTA